LIGSDRSTRYDSPSFRCTLKTLEEDLSPHDIEDEIYTASIGQSANLRQDVLLRIKEDLMSAEGTDPLGLLFRAGRRDNVRSG
jgi:hypothetical protein